MKRKLDSIITVYDDASVSWFQLAAAQPFSLPQPSRDVLNFLQLARPRWGAKRMRRLTGDIHSELVDCINHRLRIGFDRLILGANSLHETTNIDYKHDESNICNARLLRIVQATWYSKNIQPLTFSSSATRRADPTADTRPGIHKLVAVARASISAWIVPVKVTVASASIATSVRKSVSGVSQREVALKRIGPKQAVSEPAVVHIILGSCLGGCEEDKLLWQMRNRKSEWEILEL